MTIVPPGYAEASLRFTVPGPGSPAYVVFGLDPEVLTDPDQIAEDVATAWTDTGSLMEQLSAETILTEVRVLIGQDGGPDTVGTWTGSEPGGDANNAASPQVAWLMRKNTGFAGQAYRGRSYLPGVVEVGVGTDGSVDASYLTALQSAADQFLVALDTLTHPMVLLHTSGAITPTTVTSLGIDPYVATQRRRLR